MSAYNGYSGCNGYNGYNGNGYNGSGYGNAASQPSAPGMGAYSGYNGATASPPAAPGMGGYNGMPTRTPPPGQPGTAPGATPPLGLSQTMLRPAPRINGNTTCPAYDGTNAADADCPTVVSFTITAGALTVNVPPTATLTDTHDTDGIITPGGDAFDTLPTFEVNDLRGIPGPGATWDVYANLVSQWQAGTTGPNANEVLTTATTYYDADAASINTSENPAGTANITVTALTATPPGNVLPIGTPTDTGDGNPPGGTLHVLSGTAGAGSNWATWNPTLTVEIPTTASAATYYATLSTTVA